MCCWEGLGHSRFEGLQLEQPWEILHPIPALQFLVPDPVPVPLSHTGRLLFFPHCVPPTPPISISQPSSSLAPAPRMPHPDSRLLHGAPSPQTW